ncbi:YggS family pyridoxal phosphate-dependent enzyme [Myroides sp. N17-2]|uniref:YggS family pyridoxal phosphate-dependent enzyme n=1 Tax=Myroides sp. N17-2 TaxID=2030799 RepID=UPI000EFD9178|nr:YggS family pyridoxal phosphate-dependent enzyme [Myroides sp. N17-2]
MSITANLKHIKDTLPTQVTLVAVSKTKPNEDIVEAYEAGQRIFGENKIQEMTDKYEALPKDIQWHMIGHVQRNKVKYMAPYVSLIHGVDSFKLLEEIDKQAQKCERVIPCLLQMFVAEEETKFGLDKNELDQILSSEEFKALKNVKVVGLMGMATFTDNQAQVKKEFTQLNDIFVMCKKQYGIQDNLDLTIISMGMSNDYTLAIECGSTMVRIGSNIFGNRNY